MKTKNKNSRIRFTLARKITIWILLISGFFTLSLSAFQLYMDFKTGKKRIEKILAIIQSSHIKSLENEVWNMDEGDILTQLDEILNLPNISSVRLQRKNADDVLRGKIPAQRFQLRRKYALHYEDAQAKWKMEIGVLEVTASLEPLYTILKDKIFLIIISQTIKTFFVSFFIIYLIHSLITRHLNRIGKYLSEIDFHHFSEVLHIKKGRFFDFGGHDELDLLVSKINTMQIELEKSIMNYQQANEELEVEIEERKQIEHALRNSQQFNESILNASPDIIYLYDIVEKINIYSNKGMTTVLGYSTVEVKEMGEKLIENLMHPDDFIIYLNNTLPKYQHLKNGEFIEHEYRMRHKCGEWRYLLSKESVFLRLHDGNPQQIFGIITDVTDKKQAETALKESELRFRSTFEQAAVGICHADPAGGFIRLNQKFCDILGYTQDEMRAFRWQDITHPDDLQLDLHNVQQMMENKILTYAMEKRFIRKDRSAVWTNLTVSLVCNPDGSPQYFIGVIEDISYRKRIEEQLQQSQKMEAVGTLAGGIAHDFNNLLSVMMGNLSYALVNLDKDHELFQVLSEAVAGSKQAQHLTQQLLTFSRGGAPVKKVVDLNQLIMESAQFVSRGAKSTCRFILSSDLWNAEVDAGQINQVVNNLVINACQAMPEGGTIHIKTDNIEIETAHHLPIPNGRYIKMTIEDKGTGIPANHLTKIFDPYFSTKQQGSGLGLATAYSIIKRHGGHITVDSELDKGTVFHVYLPASSQEIPQSQEKKETAHQGHGKILVMDDQEPILKMVGRMLNRMGYECAFATDGAQALEMYREALEANSPFDLLILDLTIPGGMGGASLMSELLNIDPDVKAVVSSGYSNDPVMANFKDYGFCAVIPKPFMKQQLAELLNEIL